LRRKSVSSADIVSTNHSIQLFDEAHVKSGLSDENLFF
jgi:hypothetical protein